MSWADFDFCQAAGWVLIPDLPAWAAGLGVGAAGERALAGAWASPGWSS